MAHEEDTTQKTEDGHEQEQENETAQKDRTSLRALMLRILKVAGGVLLVVVLFFGIVAGFAYFGDEQSALAITARRIVPAPAASIGLSQWIGIGEVEEDVEALRFRYENPRLAEQGFRVDFSTTDGQRRLLIRKKDILNKLVDDRVIQRIARDNDIDISRSDARTLLAEAVGTGTQKAALEKRLQSEYNWTIEDFEEKIVYPDLYRAKLEERFATQNQPTQQMRATMLAAQEALVAGQTFASVAQEYSEGPSAANGGDVGWFARAQLLPQVADVAFGMEVGEVSEVIETPLGLHIIRLENIKTNTGDKLVHIRQIMVRKQTFGMWLEEQIADMTIRIYVPGFTWDKETLRVEFTDPALRQFEEKARQSENGDVSI